MLINNFAKALNNLFLPAIIKIFLLCMLAYAIGWSLFVWLITSVITHYTGIYGAEGFFMNALSTVGGMVIGWFLFPLLYPILISFFDDKMAEVIEENNYPGLPKANPPYWPTILGDILFSLKAIGLNILFLPLYFIPVIGLIVYYLLNGSMLGIQFFRDGDAFSGAGVANPDDFEDLGDGAGAETEADSLV